MIWVGAVALIACLARFIPPSVHNQRAHVAVELVGDRVSQFRMGPKEAKVDCFVHIGLLGEDYATCMVYI